MFNCDVLIVGGGPVGLFLAAELGQRGVSVQLCDNKPGTSVHPAANANSARTMEHFRRIGISPAVRASGLPSSYAPDIAYFTSIAGHELARLEQPTSADAVRWAADHLYTWPTAEPPHRCSQLYIEPILLDCARRQASCDIAFSAQMENFTQDEHGVTALVAFAATADRPAQTRSIRARYMVGCDGPRSAVRKGLNIRYDGVAGEKRGFMGGQMEAVYFYAPGLYEAGAHKPAWQYWTFGPTQRALVIAVDGTGHFIMNVQAVEGEAPSDENIRRRIATAIGADIPFEVKSKSSWTAGFALVAERLGIGRVFLAGDAAHLFTPTGGLGYNTGIEDAANLAWKLEAMVKGFADGRLGESYHVERHPIALRNTRFAREFADSIGHIHPPEATYEDSEIGASMREALGDYLAFHAYREFVIPGVQLGTRYEDSPLVEIEPGPTTLDSANLYQPCARAGHRAPHFWLSDGTSLYDRFGKGFTLLHMDGEVGESNELLQARALLPGFSLVRVGDQVVRELYGRKFALIRPDQHIAWRGNTLDESFLAAVNRTIGKAGLQ